MSQDHYRYIAIETAISLVINVALSAAFAWLMFHGRDPIAFASSNGFGIDYFPQTFMIGLMSVVVPTLLTRRRLKAAKLQPAMGRVRLPSRLIIRAPFVAVIATVVLGGAAFLLSMGLLPLSVSFSKLVAIKLIYGAFVALAVTPVGLRAALRDGARA
jgi:hypothetical protein